MLSKDDQQKFEWFSFIYFSVGAICAFIIDYTDVRMILLTLLSMVYMYTFSFVLLANCAVAFVGYKHKSFIMNIVDGFLCLILTQFIPYPLYSSIYEKSPFLYFSLGTIFASLPILFGIIDKEKIELSHVLRTTTRVCMIIFAILILIMMHSCDIQG